MSESSATIQEAEKKDEVKDEVKTDTAPSVDRGGVENALLVVEEQIRAQEAAHAEAIARLTQVRDTLRNALDPEGRMKELISALDLERQYHLECLATLKHFGFLGENNQPPSFENVSAAFNFSELEAASRFQQPKLLLMPEVSFAAMVRAIDAHKTMPGQIDTYVNKNVYGEIADDEETEAKSMGWRTSIVEGAEAMKLKAHDNEKLPMGERIRLIAAHRTQGEKGMNRRKYGFLGMDGLRQKKPVDRSGWTPLDDDEALSASQVPYACWCDDRVRFVGGDPRNRGGGARFRSSVGGDVLLR